ncbi:MAG: proton-conducting transporter membrane subunit, partial [Arenicellales bacterium]|nr:proton-conducting transporter membrane subunit [Arenicellales bacterium]
YMTVALGASAYSVAIFHLATHAFFKALLFLAAGSVIIAMHHEQDMRKMGGLRKALPITYLTCMVGSLALAGVPPFSGFFSKDAIIEAVHRASIPGAGFAYFAVLLGVIITAFYSFRLVFLTFHGEPRMGQEVRSHLHEPPRVVTVPLVLLAIPSVIAGGALVGPALSGELFGTAVASAGHEPGDLPTGAFAMLAHAPFALPFWLSLAGIGGAWVFYIARPQWPGQFAKRFKTLYWILDRKYGFDSLYQRVFADGSVAVGRAFWEWGDRRLIDGVLVNGTASMVGRLATRLRQIQSGLVYHYAFAMIIGLVLFISWLVFR